MAAANRKLPRLGIPYMDTKQNVIDAIPWARLTNQVTGSANFSLARVSFCKKAQPSVTQQ
jgi:hypothetical protein